MHHYCCYHLCGCQCLWNFVYSLHCLRCPHPLPSLPPFPPSLPPFPPSLPPFPPSLPPSTSPLPLHFPLQIEKQFLTEFDYVREAQQLDRVADNMARSPYASKVVVPRSIQGLCSKYVLTMDYLPATKVPEALNNIYKRVAGKEHITMQELRQLQHEYAGKSLATRLTAVSLFFSIVDSFKNAARFMYNITAGWVVKPLPYVKRMHMIDMEAVITLLFNVHAHQVCGYYFISC